VIEGDTISQQTLQWTWLSARQMAQPGAKEVVHRRLRGGGIPGLTLARSRQQAKLIRRKNRENQTYE
jgi:hypothetical protein